MHTFKVGRPSPAIILAAAALAFALAGTAVAANPVAKLNKKKVAKIANKEIDKRESGLSVLKAKSADTATNAANAAKLGDDQRVAVPAGQRLPAGHGARLRAFQPRRDGGESELLDGRCQRHS